MAHLHSKEQIFPQISHSCLNALKLFAAGDFPFAQTVLMSSPPSCCSSVTHCVIQVTRSDPQCSARLTLWPLLSFLSFILSSTRVLPCPRPLILLVLSSGVISSQLQEDSAPRAPAHHHQASYLCDSPEQHRVHTRCLPIPGGQASSQRPVDHGQPRTSHL